MSKRKAGASGAGAGGSDVDEGPSTAVYIAEAPPELFGFERDILLEGNPGFEDFAQDPLELEARDPFSADYLTLNEERAANRGAQERELDGELRANLLENPYLLGSPEEAGTRGSAAVWRSLRDLLREETAKKVDSSTLEELAMLRRELLTRQSLVNGVAAGIDNQIKRVDQRLSTYDPKAVSRALGKIGKS